MTTIEAVRQAIEDQDNLAALTSITEVKQLAQRVGDRIQAKDDSIDWAAIARLLNLGLQMLNSFVD